MCVCSHTRSRSSSRLWRWTTELAHRWPYLVFIGLWLIASDGWAQGPLRRLVVAFVKRFKAADRLHRHKHLRHLERVVLQRRRLRALVPVHKLRHPDFHRCDRVRQVPLRRDRPGLVQIINAPQILDAPPMLSAPQAISGQQAPSKPRRRGPCHLTCRRDQACPATCQLRLGQTLRL